MSTNNNTTIRLSALPAEIMNKVLENLLVAGTIKLAVFTSDDGENKIGVQNTHNCTNLSATILATSKKFHKTGTAMLYGRNKFIISTTPLVLQKWFMTINKSSRLVRNLTITCTRNPRSMKTMANALTNAHGLTHLKLACSTMKFAKPEEMAPMFIDWMCNVIIKRHKSGQKLSWAVLNNIEFYYGEGSFCLFGEEQALDALYYTVAVRHELRCLLGEQRLARKANFKPAMLKPATML